MGFRKLVNGEGSYWGAGCIIEAEVVVWFFGSVGGFLVGWFSGVSFAR